MPSYLADSYSIAKDIVPRFGLYALLGCLPQGGNLRYSATLCLTLMLGT